MYKKISNSNNYDSIFTVKSLKTFCWHKKKPINYKIKELPRSQDLNPIVIETTSLYGIKKNALNKYKCRIGNKPFLYEVDDFETIDLNNKKDFEYLENLLKYDFLKNKNSKKLKNI